MIKLTHRNFIKSRDYIFAHSDDISRAWFCYNFEDSDTDVFMDVLAKFQYENGGFGSLVYEYEYDGSTLFDTSTAFFRYIFYLKKKPSADHPVIQRTMQYLLTCYISEVGNWGDVYEPGVNDGAHVPWCGYNGEENTPISDEDERISTALCFFKIQIVWKMNYKNNIWIISGMEKTVFIMFRVCRPLINDV